MTSLFRHIGDELHHNRLVHRNHRVIAEVQEKFDTDPDPVNRAVFAAQIGGMLESQADHLAASWLARATTFLPKPAALRDDAAEWQDRAGDLFTEAGRK